MSSESDTLAQVVDCIIYYCILDQADCGGQLKILLRNFAVQFNTPCSHMLDRQITGVCH
jgi:hypothetical protein